MDEKIHYEKIYLCNEKIYYLYVMRKLWFQKPWKWEFVLSILC